MTNTANAPATAHAATTVVRRALRAAGIDLAGVRVVSHGPSVATGEGAFSFVFLPDTPTPRGGLPREHSARVNAVLDVLRGVPGASKVDDNAGRFASVLF